MTSRWYIIIIVALVVANLLLLRQNMALKNRPTAVLMPIGTYVSQTLLPDLPVSDRDGFTQSLRGLTRGEPFTLLVFFFPSDCPPCFKEAELWRQVRDERHIAVYGVGMSPNAREFWQWMANSDIGLDVYLDTTFTVEGMMQCTVTPLKVLCDSAGVILWADPTRQPGNDRTIFWRDLDYAMANR